MIILKNELKEIRERLISEHLLSLNKGEDNLVIELNNLDVNVYATTEEEATISLEEGRVESCVSEPAGPYYSLIVYYKLNEVYRLILSPYNTFTIKTLKPQTIQR